MALSGNNNEVVVLDAETGNPVADAEVIFYSTYYIGKDNKEVERKKTDASGKVMYKSDSRIRSLVARKGADQSMPLQRVSSGSFVSWGDGIEKPVNNLKLLTDRSLYRPGQAVYVKGIAYTQKGDTADVIPNMVYEVVLRDVNRREISRKELRTNEFGSFTTEFMLPTACLNGNYIIEAFRGESEGWANIQAVSYTHLTLPTTPYV